MIHLHAQTTPHHTLLKLFTVAGIALCCLAVVAGCQSGNDATQANSTEAAEEAGNAVTDEGGSQSTAGTPGEYQHLSGEEVQQLLEADDTCALVDVRQPLAYQYEHIEGAVNLPQDQIADTAETMFPDKNQVIILYCDYGGVSKVAAEDMVDMGYTNIIEFDGLEDWPGETVIDESLK